MTGSTGMAASNFDNGRTIHGVLRWNPKGTDYDYDHCAENIKDADLLVIDEVSMLNSDIIEHLVRCLRKLKRQPQKILSGDFFQLPPVLDKIYPFENPHWPAFELTPCVLNEIVRQRDAEFVKMLEKAMSRDVSCIDYFNHCSCQRYIEGAISICTKNEYADDINNRMFNGLPGVAKKYEALGETLNADFRNTRIQRNLYIKKNMRVMALRNDPAGRFQNGSLGTVLDMEKDQITVIFDNGHTVEISRIGYTLNSSGKGEIRELKIEQFPIIGGYAISIHKSQGQTFDAVNIMAPRCWAPGQLYVALSRARDIKGIHLMVPISDESLKTDPRVISYCERLYRLGVA